MIIVCIVLFSVLVPGCDNVPLVGNGFCNDVTNSADCNFDGGDCCVENANTNSCSECACHLLETCAAGYHPLVGNGFCDDDTNVVECDYDGGDCCSNPNMVGNEFCNDETNNPECNYDGGDCCGICINTDICSDCLCLDEDYTPANDLSCKSLDCKEEWEWFVGNADAYCDDFVNTASCNFDGGDCCGSNVKTTYCAECVCYEDLNCTPSLLQLVGNGYCNDESNIADCNYDGGDCCGICSNKDYCVECLCHVEAEAYPSVSCNYI